VGARAVAVRDVPPDAVVVGNPARVVSHRQTERVVTMRGTQR
jgi:acetyltransferase-like isoleucine patch superfamily enzyme